MNDNFSVLTKHYHDACHAIEQACLAALREAVRETAPTATGFRLEGEYGEQGDVSISLTKILGAKVADDDFDALTDSLTEYTDWLSATTNDEYLGTEDFEVTDV